MITSVLAARASAARRVGAGNVMIGQTPSIWIVAPEFEPMAIRALAQVAAAEVANVNPLAGRLQIISEPRLTDENTSYLVVPPATMDGAVRVSALRRSGPNTRGWYGLNIGHGLPCTETALTQTLGHTSNRSNTKSREPKVPQGRET